MTAWTRTYGVSLAALLASAGVARAQTTTTTTVGEDTSAEGLAAPPAPEPTFWEGGGVRVSDTLIFHPSAEISTAYQSNVFYQDDSDPRPAGRGTGTVGAPILRIGVGGSMDNNTRIRMEAQPAGGSTARRGVAFKGDINLTWNQYISDVGEVSQQSDLGIGLLLDARFDPDGSLTWQVREGYTRAVNPPLVEAYGNVDRDKNDLMFGAIYKPGGGAIQGYANYTFGVDLFESGAAGDVGNRMSHTFNLGAKWQWLPKTQFSTDVFFAVWSPTNPAKPSSMPLKIWAGTSTLITPTFGTVIKLGYGYGFYSAGPSFNNYLANIEGRWAMGPTLRFAFGYLHDYVDAMIGNYYGDHAFYARLALLFAGRWQARAKAEVRLRDWDGIVDFGGVQFCTGSGADPCDRFDVVTAVEAGLDYQINPWLYGGAVFNFSSVTTDSFINAGGDVDSNGYVWSEFLVRMAAKF